MKISCLKSNLFLFYRYPAILESVEKDLENLKEPILNIVDQLNNKINKIDKTESPVSIGHVRNTLVLHI